MTELSLILAIAIVGLGLAGYLVRWVLARPLGDSDMNRVANLVRASCEGFMRRQSSTILALSGVATGFVFLAYGLRRGGPELISRLETGVWLTGSCALGALSVIVIGQVATFLFTRGTIRVASGARTSVDRALVIALRSGAVVGLFTTTLATLGISALVLAILVYHGAFAEDRSGAALAAPFVPTLIAGFPLGAGFAALLCHLSGGFFAKSSDIGADVGGREAALAEDDADNPAAVANLAGDCVGECVGQSTSAFAAAAAEDVAVMFVSAATYAANPSIRSALTLVLLPILARSFGLLGAGFGVMIVRTDESEKPDSALYRGFVVATILHAVGFAGAAKWLLPSIWREVVVAAGLGVASTFVLSPLVNQFTAIRGRVRELAETARAGPGLAILGGLVTGLDAAVGPAVLVAVSLAGAYAVGAHTHLAGGGLLGVGVAMMGMAGASPYLTSLAAGSAMIDAAGGVVVMSVGRDRPDVRGRLLVLDTVGTSSKALARVHSAILAILAALLLTDAFLRAPADVPPAIPKEPLSLVNPLVYVAALAGVLLFGWLVARATSGVTRCSRRIVDEVRRQLVGRSSSTPRPPREEDAGEDRLSVDHRPCVEIASRFALRHMLVPGVGALVLPVLALVGIHFLALGPFPISGRDAVAALVVGGTMAALASSLVIAALGAAWANAKKYILTGAHGGRFLVDEAGGRAENPTFQAASAGDTVGDALKDVAIPVAQLFARLLPILALIAAPFLG